MEQYIERVVDLTDPRANRIYNMSMEEARERALKGGVEAIREIDGSFAIVAQSGKTVRLARSLDRPLRYFLAKREEGPALIIADRIDTIHQWLKVEKLDHQFHPGYTRMVPAHYVVEIQLVGCPDPDPSYTRFFTPERDVLPPDTERIGRAYIGALAEEISKWLRQMGGEINRFRVRLRRNRGCLDPDPIGQRRDGDAGATRRIFAASSVHTRKSAGLWAESETWPGFCGPLGFGAVRRML